MELPRGLFWIRASSGISEMHIVSLMRMADALYREVLILTDMPVAYEGNSGKVTINGDPSGSYHYCFLTDARSEIRSVHERFSRMIAPRGWKCWAPPRPNDPTPVRDAQIEADNILRNYTFDAVCQPNVMVETGPNRDVIYGRSGIISSVMCPNSGEGFWREIFRSCGQFELRANIQRGEM